MTPIQKKGVFLLSVLLLFPSGAFGMNEKKEGFFSKWFGKKSIASKQETQMVDMKKVAPLNNKQDLENWVILEDEPSEEELSVSLNTSKKDFEMKSMMQLDDVSDKDLRTWEIVDTSTSKKYDKYSLIYSNDPIKINNYRTQKIIELFENF